MRSLCPASSTGRLSGLTLLVIWLLLAGRALAEEPVRFEVRAGEPATLRFWNRPIATFHAQLDDIRPIDRAHRAHQKIVDTLADRPGNTASAAAGTLGNLSGYWILIDGQAAFALIEQDADRVTGENLDQVVAQAVAKLQGALDARRAQQRLPDLLKRTAFALVATLVMALILWLILRVHRRALSQERLLAWVDLRVGGIGLRPHLRTIERAAIRLTSLGLGAIAIYFWLTLVLWLFPFSQPWGADLARFLTDLVEQLTTGILGAIPGLFTVLVIFVLTRLVVQAVDGFFRAVEQGLIPVSWAAPDTAKASRRLIVVLIWVFALTVAYPYVPGSDSAAFKGISVLLGLMVSLGSAGLVNQVMSGLVVAYSRALKVGEYVRVGQTEGTVSDVGMLSTKIVTPKREAITVPNAVLVGSAITNYSRLAADQGAMVATTVTIGYDTPWRQVHALLVLAAERTSFVRKEPRPFVLQRTLADFYPEYQLIVHLDHPESRYLVLSDLHAAIQDVFNEYGVQIMSPNFRAQPPEKVWVPKENWHAPPAREGED